MGAVILEVRRKRGMTQGRVAARGNISENHVGKLERGEVSDPGLLSVAKIAHALDVSVVPFVLAFGGRLPASTPLLERPDKHLVAPPPSALGATLRALRRSVDLSQAALAEEAGLAPATLSLLECGRKTDPALSTLMHIAIAMERSEVDMSVDDVLRRLACAFTGEAAPPLGACRWLRRQRERQGRPSIGNDT